MFRCNKDRRKSSTGSGRSKLNSTGDNGESGDLPMSPRTPHSPPTIDPVQVPVQEQDNLTVGDASDDDQMVICEEPVQEIDLKCKEKVTDSDSESQSDMEPTVENRAYSQQIFSPAANSNTGEVTCRPKPIKACLPTPENSMKYNSSSTVLNIPYHTPVNPTGISGFQPTGGGAFKTMPASPKIVKNEVKTEGAEWTGGSFVVNSVKNEPPNSPAGIVITKITTDCITKWITTIAKTPTTTKPTTTFAILKPPIKSTNIIQVTDPSNQFQRQQMTLLLNSNQSTTTLCLTSDPERTHPVVAVVASSPSDQNLQYVYMHTPMQIVPKNTPPSVIVSQSSSRPQSNNHDLSPVQQQLTAPSTYTNATGKKERLKLRNCVERLSFVGILVKIEKEPKPNEKVIKSPSEVPASPRLNNSENVLSQETDKEFKLAPTPAQLGKAPLQRRQSMGT